MEKRAKVFYSLVVVTIVAIVAILVMFRIGSGDESDSSDQEVKDVVGQAIRKGSAKNKVATSLSSPMDVIKNEYKKNGLSETQLYQDMLYSNTLLYDGRQDYFLLYDLNTINDPKASSKEKTAAKNKVYKKVNKMYSQFSDKSLKDTAWLISNEKYLKPLMFDKMSLADSNKLLNPKDLQELLAKTGECIGEQKKTGDVVGEGADSKGSKEADKGGAGKEGAAGTGGISDACNTFGGGSGMVGGSLAGGESASIIACMDKYKASKGQAGSMGMSGGGKGGSTGGGGTNPGGMTGYAVAGGNAPITTTGSDGGEGAQTGRLSSSSKCFGLDLGKMGGFAGEEKQGETDKPVINENSNKGDGGTVIEQKDGKLVKSTTYTIKGDPSDYVPGCNTCSGPPVVIMKHVTVPGENGQAPITNSEPFNSVTPGPDANVKIHDIISNKIANDITKGMAAGNKVTASVGTMVADKLEKKGFKVNWYDPFSDSSTPCGADAAGLASCIMGSGKQSASEQFKEMVAQCVTLGSGAEKSGGSGGAVPGKEGGAIKPSKPKFSDQGACAGFSGACYTYLNNIYGSGAGIADVDPNMQNPCSVDASEAMDLIMQTLVIDPLPLNLMFSNVILQEAGIKAMLIGDLGSEKVGKALEKAAGSTGADKQEQAASTGAVCETLNCN